MAFPPLEAPPCRKAASLMQPWQSGGLLGHQPQRLQELRGCGSSETADKSVSTAEAADFLDAAVRRSGVKRQGLMRRISRLNKFFNCIEFHLFLRDEHQLKA